jgi:hypothetical protein
MKIEVQMAVSTSTETQTFTLEDLGITKLEWELLSEEEQHDIIENAVFDLPGQPYWMVDKITEG